MRTRKLLAALTLVVVTMLFAQGAAQAGGYVYGDAGYGRWSGGYSGGNRAYLQRYGQRQARPYGYGRPQPRYGLDYRGRYGDGGHHRYYRPRVHSRQ